MLRLDFALRFERVELFDRVELLGLRLDRDELFALRLDGDELFALRLDRVDPRRAAGIGYGPFSLAACVGWRNPAPIASATPVAIALLTSFASLRGRLPGE